MTLTNRQFLNYVRGDRPSAYDMNHVRDIVDKLQRSLVGTGVMDSAGMTTRAKQKTLMMRHRLYKVISWGHDTDDEPGIYGVVPQRIAFWDDDAGNPKFLNWGKDLHNVTYSAWTDVTAYKRYNAVTGTADYVSSNNANGKLAVFQCLQDHTSAAANDEPFSGANWKDYWRQFSGYALNLYENKPIATGSGYSPAMAADQLM